MYSILLKVLDTQEVTGSSPVPPSSQAIEIKGFVSSGSCVVCLGECRAVLMTTGSGNSDKLKGFCKIAG
jgi:hypothetical protein